MEQTPTIGRVVHYVSYGTPGGEYKSECRAAIITGVHYHDLEDVTPIVTSIDICVLNPSGLFFNQNVKFGHPENPEAGGTWHWPERV